MKKINLLTVLIAITMFMASFQTTNAQDKGKNIANFEAGRTLTKADIKFINSISGGKADAKDAMIGRYGFKEGMKISAPDATAINNAMAEFGKTHKTGKAADAKPIGK